MTLRKGESSGMTPNQQTLAIYSRIAPEYREKTETLDATTGRDVLTGRLAPGAHILDAGCGWGRDARTFVEAGFQVTAFDGCPEMAQEASRFLCVPVATLRFQDMSFPEMFDGVWARASLLHLEPQELEAALVSLMAALKPNGWLYACFKEGEGERVDAQGRYFQDMTEARFRQLLARTGGTLHECYVTEDQFGRTERWINFLVAKR
jgi:cyclopropane fatty-acyl-phospholipid synthase-like methyltransferase